MKGVPFLSERLKYPGGDSAYERGGDARRKFWIKPLKETDLGVAQPFFFWPLKETLLKHRQMKNTVTFNDGKDIVIEYLDYMNGVNKTN